MSAARRNRRAQRHLPTSPPGLDRLRDARHAIDPERVYPMRMSDGGVFMVSGSALLETADAMVALGDAIQAGDGPRVRTALELVRVNQEQTAAVILCTKVGHAACTPPPGYLTTVCSHCGSAVWISPKNHGRIASLGARPLCSDCVPPPGR
jgi:hypothetical protein